jgi:hypothetical protein
MRQLLLALTLLALPACQEECVPSSASCIDAFSADYSGEILPEGIYEVLLEVDGTDYTYRFEIREDGAPVVESCEHCGDIAVHFFDDSFGIEGTPDTVDFTLLLNGETLADVQFNPDYTGGEGCNASSCLTAHESLTLDSNRGSGGAGGTQN